MQVLRPVLGLGAGLAGLVFRSVPSALPDHLAECAFDEVFVGRRYVQLLLIIIGFALEWCSACCCIGLAWSGPRLPRLVVQWG